MILDDIKVFQVVSDKLLVVDKLFYIAWMDKNNAVIDKASFRADDLAHCINVARQLIQIGHAPRGTSGCCVGEAIEQDNA